MTKSVSTLNNSSISSIKHLKSKTSLMIKQQKIINSDQLCRTNAFLKFSKSVTIKNFLESNLYLIGFCFIETPNFSLTDLVTQLNIPGDRVIRADDLVSNQQLALKINPRLKWLAQLFSKGPTFLVGFSDESEYLSALKKLILIEEDVAAKMLALIFSAERNYFTDLQKASCLTLDPRQFYKKWDSSKSILIELLNEMQSPADSLTSTLSYEIGVGASLSLLSITVLPVFNEN